MSAKAISKQAAVAFCFRKNRFNSILKKALKAFIWFSFYPGQRPLKHPGFFHIPIGQFPGRRPVPFSLPFMVTHVLNCRILISDFTLYHLDVFLGILTAYFFKDFYFIFPASLWFFYFYWCDRPPRSFILVGGNSSPGRGLKKPISNFAAFCLQRADIQAASIDGQL
jgi:hypothetical protein